MNWEKGRQLESMTDGTNTLSFKYDSSGIRTSKTVNGTQTKFTYIGTTLVSQKTGNEVINFAYSAGGAPYGFTYNGTSYFYLLNLQGDVIGIYDSTGTIVVQYLYDSWGKLVSTTGSLADTIGVKNPLRYRGYYYDNETGWYYLQSRYYDPETCRFINADSLLIAGDYLQGTNMFAYCYNNPINSIDCSGYCHGYANDPNLDSPFSGVRYGYNCGSYGRHVRNPKKIDAAAAAIDMLGYASDGVGMLGSEFEVAASTSSKLTNVGYGIWEMRTTIPKVALAGKKMGRVSTYVSISLSFVNVINIIVNRDDLSIEQKAKGTVIEAVGLGANMAVGALASKIGSAAAAASSSHPLLAAGVVIVGVSVVGGIIIYNVTNNWNEKVGI